MVQTTKLVYSFEEGNAAMKDLLGGKGANLSEMAGMGLPVPPGFTVTTEACLSYFDQDRIMPDGLWEQVREYMERLEAASGKGFGSPVNPLLVSVRSGARVSMPGMMDTILNLGVNDHIVQGLSKLMGDERSAYDAYRRFLQLYAQVVMHVPSETFEAILSSHKAAAGVSQDHQLTAARLADVVDGFKTAIQQATGEQPPTDPWIQLHGAVGAVFESWNSPRAISYRNHYGLDHDWGTAVNVVSMVFGNLGDHSGTGVLFTRNPSDGRRQIYGEYLSNGQGEDVVAGTRTPEPISALAKKMPEVYAQLEETARRLETHYRDVQDIEFTIEAGSLYILQTRNAQRTVQAAVKSAVDMVREGLLSKNEALKMVNAEEFSQLFLPRYEPEARAKAIASGSRIAKGAAASPGAATGRVYFDATRAEEAAARGIPVILVRPETKPEDIHGVLGAKGVLTSRGGVTSHAAVVTRGLGVPCVVGCEALDIDIQAGNFTAGGATVWEGYELSIDGTTGDVFLGLVETIRPDIEEQEEAGILLEWADETKRLGVWANADTPADAERSVSMGAEGIGLCRTEHMFLGPERVPIVQEMLFSARDMDPSDDENEATKRFRKSLEDLKKFQIDDFAGILEAMGERPVIIRLLDAPLHEFLPRHDQLVRELAELRATGASGSELEPLEQRLGLVEGLMEANPMLGHRGCRLGVTFPDVYCMQVEAIITASARLLRKGIAVRPEIMIPMTSHANELKLLKERLAAVAVASQERLEVSVPYIYGTMIEVPRAALTADQLAESADFFSFGTNDLTQTTFAFSRDDAEAKFLNQYVDDAVLPFNPFTTLDLDGVGALISMAVEKGRKVKPELEVGICGEHGGDPASIAFCHKEGISYVSCSPYRVPLARLAAAQAALDDDA